MGGERVVAVQPQVAALSQNIYHWLTRNGFPVRDFTVQYGTPDWAQTTDIGNAAPGEVYISPTEAGTLGAVAARRRLGKGLNERQIDAVRVLMHEQLHQMRYGRTPDVYGSGSRDAGTPGGYEEGATEAVTRDLLPIFINRMFGGESFPGAPVPLNGETGAAYPQQVTNVRQMSTFGSGAKSYKDRAARVWRRQFLHADEATRQQMVQQASAARAAWGQRTGR